MAGSRAQVVMGCSVCGVTLSLHNIYKRVHYVVLRPLPANSFNTLLPVVEVVAVVCNILLSDIGRYWHIIAMRKRSLMHVFGPCDLSRVCTL